MLGGGAGCRMLVLGRCPDSVSVLLCITDGAAEGWHPLVISCWSDQPRAKEKAGGSGGQCSGLFPTHHVEPWEVS